MSPISILACFAHPDDEGLTGGLLATCAAEGGQVTLVCTTRGEVGEISDPALATPETLGEVREQELRCAAKTLGINPPIFLGFRDSGMAGTPENQDSRAYVNQPDDDVVGRLVQIIRELRPDVVLTFDPGGAYGHPDHIAIHKHTVEAFHKAADSGYRPVFGHAHQADRLLFTMDLRNRFASMRQAMVERGIDTTDYDRFAKIMPPSLGLPAHVAIELTDELAETKWAAFNCHRTQINPNSFFSRMPEDLRKQFNRIEEFHQAAPPLPDGTLLRSLSQE